MVSSLGFILSWLMEHVAFSTGKQSWTGKIFKNETWSTRWNECGNRRRVVLLGAFPRPPADLALDIPIGHCPPPPKKTHSERERERARERLILESQEVWASETERGPRGPGR